MIRPLIVVGLKNVERRRDLLSATDVPEEKKIAPNAGGADRFRTFLREELKPLKKQIDAAEKAVSKLTADIASIDTQLAGDLYARDPGKATALSKARAEAAQALAKAEEDWLAASAAYEDAMA